MYLLLIICLQRKYNVKGREKTNKLETINNLAFSLLKIHHVYAIMRFNYT